jgi:hypothetical protein
MIDGCTANRIARLEHEERVRSLARDEQLLGDLWSGADVWITRTAGAWQSQYVGSLLLSLRKGLTRLGGRLKHERAVASDSPLVGKEPSGMPSSLSERKRQEGRRDKLKRP